MKLHIHKAKCNAQVLKLTLTIPSIGTQNETHVAVA